MEGRGSPDAFRSARVAGKRIVELSSDRVCPGPPISVMSFLSPDAKASGMLTSNVGREAVSAEAADAVLAAIAWPKQRGGGHDLSFDDVVHPNATSSKWAPPSSCAVTTSIPRLRSPAVIAALTCTSMDSRSITPPAPSALRPVWGAACGCGTGARPACSWRRGRCPWRLDDRNSM